MMSTAHFDYAVLGGGAAGLSLLCHLQLGGLLADKRVVLVEPEAKDRHDRTWSFWETEAGPFEAAVSHRWSSIGVHNDRGVASYDLAPYSYKVIQGPDFYRAARETIDRIPGLVRLKARAEDIRTENDLVYFKVADNHYTSDWAFSSLPHPVDYRKIRAPYLDQHFRGWYIATDRAVFDPDHATLMDFRLPQRGATRFLYVLPLSERRAVVEIAIFSNDHLPAEEYDREIGNYLKTHWRLVSGEKGKVHPDESTYRVEHVEAGVIPMTTYAYPRRTGRVFHLGLGGGQARPSTGYTFYNIQRRCTELVKRMQKNGGVPDLPAAWPERHLRYDATLLSILQSEKLRGADLFPDLFRRNPTGRVLGFLNGETNLLSELRLMSTTDIPVFARAFVREVISNVRR